MACSFISGFKTVDGRVILQYFLSSEEFSSEVVCSLSPAAARLELSSTLTHAPSLADFILLSALCGPPVQATLHCFPDICSTFPFCVAGVRKWNGKSAPPPTVATWQGRRAVGQEPAGHSRAYLWSAFSSLQSEALCCAACLRTHSVTLPTLFLAISHTLKSKNWSQEQPEKMHFLLPHYVPPASSFPRLFILMGLTHEKGSPLCRNGGEGLGHISRAVHRCPSHSGQNE